LEKEKEKEKGKGRERGRADYPSVARRAIVYCVVTQLQQKQLQAASIVAALQTQ
jgi:hypothetical protein